MKDLRYLTDSYDEGIRRIREIDAPLNFIFMADQHNRMNELTANRINPDNPPPFELAADAIDSMQYILDRCPNISMVICGGDIGDDSPRLRSQSAGSSTGSPASPDSTSMRRG